MTLTNEHIKQRLVEKFGEQVSNFSEPYALLTFEAPKELNLKVLNFLYDDAGIKIQISYYSVRSALSRTIKAENWLLFITCITLRIMSRIRFKIFTDINKPDVYTATGLFSAANWLERETYDFYGVNFVGHPNLKRILNVDEMDYFPMRKEYPLEDSTSIDKDDEMFGRGGTLGYGTEKTDHGTIAEEEKHDEGKPVL